MLALRLAPWLGALTLAAQPAGQVLVRDIRGGSEAMRLPILGSGGVAGSQFVVSTSDAWTGDGTWITDGSPGSLRLVGTERSAAVVHCSAAFSTRAGGGGSCAGARPSGGSNT